MRDRCSHHVATPRILRDQSKQFVVAVPLLSLVQMVRSTIIVRASDALPLAASVDDEQVGFHSACVPSRLYAKSDGLPTDRAGITGT